MKKLIIGDIPGGKDLSGVLKDFLVKWENKVILPKHLAALLQRKNAWDGSFKDNPPKKADGLLTEFINQLMERSITLPQLKLFLLKKNYLDPVLCRALEIKEFYKEVFNLKVPLKNSLKNELTDAGFMIFPKEIKLANLALDEKWGEYVQPDNPFDPIFRAFHRCEDFSFKYGVHPDRFTKFDVRTEANSYLLAYREEIVWGVYDNVKRVSTFSYPRRYREKAQNSQGVTLREVYLLLMFEWWKTGSYVKLPEDYEGPHTHICIPCYGSVCKTQDHDGNNLIPIFQSGEDEIGSVGSSVKYRNWSNILQFFHVKNSYSC